MEILLTDVSAKVAAVLAQIKGGVETARAAGLIAELPEKVDFQMNIISGLATLSEVATEQDTNVRMTTSTAGAGSTTVVRGQEIETRGNTTETQTASIESETATIVTRGNTTETQTTSTESETATTVTRGPETEEQDASTEEETPTKVTRGPETEEQTESRETAGTNLEHETYVTPNGGENSTTTYTYAEP